jgi:hypothetical protein
MAKNKQGLMHVFHPRWWLKGALVEDPSRSTPEMFPVLEWAWEWWYVCALGME